MGWLKSCVFNRVSLFVYPFLYLYPTSSFRKHPFPELNKLTKVAPASTSPASSYCYFSSASSCPLGVWKSCRTPEIGSLGIASFYLLLPVSSSAPVGFKISFSNKFPTDGAKLLNWTQYVLPKLLNQEWTWSITHASVDQVKSSFEVHTVGLKLVQPWEQPVSGRWAACILFQRSLNVGVSGLFHSHWSSQGAKIWEWIYLR